MGKEKLSRLEKYWILYDVANSAFILLVATIVPIYFNSLAEAAGISEVDYLAYWGYAASVATLIVALIGPIFGTMADMKNFKKPIFTASMMVGVLGCAALSFPTSWVVFLAIFVIAKVGFSASLIFYDSMLSDITDPDRMDEVSAQGYAWGYIGSCIPFLISLGIVLGNQALGISMTTAMGIAFFLNAAWCRSPVRFPDRRSCAIMSKRITLPSGTTRSGIRLLPCIIPFGKSNPKNIFSSFCSPSFSLSTGSIPSLIWQQRLAVRWDSIRPCCFWPCC